MLLAESVQCSAKPAEAHLTSPWKGRFRYPFLRSATVCMPLTFRSIGAPQRLESFEPNEEHLVMYQVINRVISVGERAGWGAAEVGDAASSTEDRQLPERWVAFGASSIAQVAVVQPVLLDGSLAAPAQSRNLRDYLQLPPSEYSLLDPKWVDRFVLIELRLRLVHCRLATCPSCLFLPRS